MTTSAVRLNVDRRGGVSVVRSSGRLDLSTHVSLRDGLLKAAADYPAALVVDTDGLVVASAAMLAVFAVVAGRIGDWPGIPLLLVARSPAQRALLMSSPARLVVPVHESLDTALRTCVTLTPYRCRRIHLPGAALSVVRAQLFTTDALLAWNLPALVDDANRIAVELTDNVVRHARTQMWIRLTERGGSLRIAVRDLSPARPSRVAGGLAVVGALSSRWGTMPTAGGKVVWARLDREVR